MAVRLGELLLKEKRITPAQLQDALNYQKTNGGKLGFNLKVLIETEEETGSPGLKAFCEQNKALLAADVLIASDGPRLSPGRPTVYLGTRGALNFTLSVDPGKGAHHSGNWGGLIANPGGFRSLAVVPFVELSGRVERV